jgi:D-hydroxyproline dehydrogenase subunit alpha
MTREVEVLVVGAGPAGLAAAAEATAAGARTLVVDAGEATGGQYYARPPGGSWDAGLPATVVAGARPELLDVRLRTAVWGAFGDAVALVTGEESELVRPRSLVLATGAAERALPIPGWDRPGVVAPGALQRLLKVARVVPTGGVVVAGSGPFLLAVAADLRRAGAEVRAVVERRARRDLMPLLWPAARSGIHRREALRFARALRGVPVRFDTEVAALEERGVRLSDGSRIEADVACVGHGFVPRLELASMLGLEHGPDGVRVDGSMRTSRPGVFAAGEATGVGGAPLAATEGRLAGQSAARHAGQTGSDEREQHLRRERSRLLAFAERLQAVYPVPPVLAYATPDTTICRCEGVLLAELGDAGDTGLPLEDARAAKARLRCGMGPCQGAMCLEAVSAATEGADGERRTPRVRPPLQPLTVGTVAAARTIAEDTAP